MKDVMIGRLGTRLAQALHGSEQATMQDAGLPRVFIGSSAEGLPVARSLQVLLDHDAEVEVWHQGLFAPGSSTLESLVAAAVTFDFAILVVSPDDTSTMRGQQRNTTRDNVIFELGLFMGVLGKERTFMTYDREDMPDLPSDLAGITPVTYRLHSTGNLDASLGAASTQLSGALVRLGRRTATQMVQPADHRDEQPAGTQMLNIYREGRDLYVLRNVSKVLLKQVSVDGGSHNLIKTEQGAVDLRPNEGLSISINDIEEVTYPSHVEVIWDGQSRPLIMPLPPRA